MRLLLPPSLSAPVPPLSSMTLDFQGLRAARLTTTRAQAAQWGARSQSPAVEDVQQKRGSEATVSSDVTDGNGEVSPGWFSVLCSFHGFCPISQFELSVLNRFLCFK